MTPKVEKDLELARLELERAGVARNDAIRRAAAKGASYAEIGRAVGLSRQRIFQIVKGSGEEDG